MWRLWRRITFGIKFDPETSAKTEIARLTDRSLLIVNGPDCQRLLQGIVTNDLKSLAEHTFQGRIIRRIALHTLFLSPKGRIITDAFLIRPRFFAEGEVHYKEDELWIDVASCAKGVLKKHIQRYMWRKRVKMIDVDEQPKGQGSLTVFSSRNCMAHTVQPLLGSSIELPENEVGEDQTYANLMYFDPRGSQFGFRIISSQEETEMDGHIVHQSLEDYHRTFALLGQCGQRMIEDKLPFMFNFDLMGSMCFTKGCFLGQQNISRAFFTGIVRRRVFPFMLDEPGARVEVESVLVDATGKELGKVLESSGNTGVALCNYLEWINSCEGEIRFVQPAGGCLISPFERSLRDYLRQMIDKQKKMEQFDM